MFCHRGSHGIVVACVSALMLMCAGALAQELPHYDVETACANQTAGARQAPNWNQLFNLCISEEQGAYDYARLLWPKAPQSIHDYCTSIGPTLDGKPVMTYGFYQRLAGCLEARLPLVEPPQHFNY